MADNSGATEAELKAAVDAAEGLGRLNHRRMEALGALADFYAVEGRARDEEPLRVKALAIQERIFGPEHRALAHPLRHLGNLYEKMGRYVEAEAVFSLALKILQRDSVTNGADVARVLMDVARLAGRFCRWEMGDRAWARAQGILHVVEGDVGPASAEFWLQKGEYLAAAGRWDKAREDLDRAEKQFRGVDESRVADVQRVRRWVHERQGRWDLALQELRRSISRKPIHHVADADVFVGWARALLAQGRVRAAQAVLRRIPPRALTAEALLVRAEAALHRRRFEAAEEDFLRAWTLWEDRLGPDAPGVLRAQQSLAELYFHRGAREEAERLLKHLAVASERIYGMGHPSHRQAVENLRVAREDWAEG